MASRKCAELQAVSIHAPAMGATLQNAVHISGGCFNPRSRDGSDAALADQSFSTSSFNPRSRDGSDLRMPKRILHMQVSIHAPAMGATFCRMEANAKKYVSIHAPAMGAT